MITDIGLLSELNELEGTRVYKYLKERLQAATSGMANAPSDRLANIQAGRFQELTEFISAIETAKEEAMKLREKSKTNMSKSF